MSLRYKVEVNGKVLEVKLLSRSNSNLAFEVDGSVYKVDIEPVLEPAQANPSFTPTRAASSSTKGLAKATKNDEKCINAPMPGVLTSIKVKPNQEVSKGDVVLTIEAMKMENNIYSDRDGKVTEVLVSEGQEVNQGDVLIKF